MSRIAAAINTKKRHSIDKNASVPKLTHTDEATLFAEPKSSYGLVRLSKPFEIHPALLALLVVLFVSLMISLWGEALFPALTTIILFVLVGTAGVFLILYTLVWLARTIRTRRHLAPNSFLIQKV